MAFVINTFNENNASFDSEEIINFLEKAKDTSSLIPEEYSKDSIDFLSLRFNTPKWLVKMWRKAYGDKLTYKILKANSKAPLNTVRINPFAVGAEEELLLTELFEKTFVESVMENKNTTSVIYQKVDDC